MDGEQIIIETVKAWEVGVISSDVAMKIVSSVISEVASKPFKIDCDVIPPMAWSRLDGKIARLGRPPTGNAMTNAERQAKWRKNHPELARKRQREGMAKLRTKKKA